MTAERFAAMMPVFDTIADDPETIDLVEETFRDHEWYDIVRRSGGIPGDPPTVERVDNLQYGWPLTDEDGEPLLDDNGEQLTNRIKLYLVANGYAERADNRPATWSDDEWLHVIKTVDPHADVAAGIAAVEERRRPKP